MENRRITRLTEALRARMENEEERASLSGTLVREMIAKVARHMGRSEAMFRPLPELEWRAPGEFSYDVQPLSGGTLEWLRPHEGERQGRVIYQLHGGAYIAGLTNQYRSNAVRLSRLSGGAPVVSLDYRTAPEYVFPCALEDALEGFDAIMHAGYREEDVLLFGDSAGGNLALSLCLSLRAQGRKLPRALVLVSPWTDLAAAGDSYRDNLYRDPMFGIDEGQDEALAGVTTVYAGKERLDNPLLSPAYASFEGFPPMLLQAGSYEMLLSDSETVHARALACGVESTLTVYEGMFHVFSICCGELIPEGRQAWEEVRAFMARHL